MGPPAALDIVAAFFTEHQAHLIRQPRDGMDRRDPSYSYDTCPTLKANGPNVSKGIWIQEGVAQPPHIPIIRSQHWRPRAYFPETPSLTDYARLPPYTK